MMKTNKIKRIFSVLSAAVVLLAAAVSGYAAYKPGVSNPPYEFYTIEDTYESGTTPAIPVSGDFQNSLTPQDGSATVIEQSDAAVLVYSETTDSDVPDDKTILSFDKNWYNGKYQVYSFDAYIPKAANYIFTVMDGDSSKEGVLLSVQGWVAPYHSNWIPVSNSNDWWFESSNLLNNTPAQNAGRAVKYSFGCWNKITMVSDIEGNNYYLYLNNALVDKMDSAKLSSTGSAKVGQAELGSGGLLIRTVKSWNATSRGGSLILDNIKVGNLDSFDGASTLTNQLDNMNVKLNEDFEGSEYAFPITGAEGEFGKLAPDKGTAMVLKQSDAAVISYGAMSNRGKELRISRETAPSLWPESDSANNNNVEVLDFDVYMYKKASLALTIKDVWAAKYNLLISENGYVTQTANQSNFWDSTQTPGYLDTLKNGTKDDAAKKFNCGAADFEPYKWHNIKIVYNAYDETLSSWNWKTYLYVDENYVGSVGANSFSKFDRIDISCYTDSVANEPMIAFDNLKIGVLKDVPYEINTFNVTNASGEATENFASGESYNVNLSLTNFLSAPKGVQIMIAQYDGDGILKNVSLSDKFTASKGVELNKTIAFTADAAAEKIKVFAWDDMAPLKSAVDMTKTQQ